MGAIIVYALIYRANSWHPGHHLVAIGSGAYLGHLILTLIMNQLQSRNLPVFSEWLAAWPIAIILCCWVLGEIARQTSKKPGLEIPDNTPPYKSTEVNKLIGLGAGLWLITIVAFVLYENALRPAVAWDMMQYWTIDLNAFLQWQQTNPAEGSVRIGYLHPNTLHLIHIWSAWLGKATGSTTWLLLPSSALYLGTLLSLLGALWALTKSLNVSVVLIIPVASLPMLTTHATLAGYAEPWVAGGMLISIALMKIPTQSITKLAFAPLWLFLIASFSFWKGESLAYTVIAIVAISGAVILSLRQPFLKYGLISAVGILCGILYFQGFDVTFLGGRLAWIPDENLLYLGRRATQLEIVDSLQLASNTYNAWILNGSFRLSVLALFAAIFLFVTLKLKEGKVAAATDYGFLLSILLVAFMVLAQGISEYLLATGNASSDTVFSRASLIALATATFSASLLIGEQLHTGRTKNGRTPEDL